MNKTSKSILIVKLFLKVKWICKKRKLFTTATLKKKKNRNHKDFAFLCYDTLEITIIIIIMSVNNYPVLVAYQVLF